MTMGSKRVFAFMASALIIFVMAVSMAPRSDASGNPVQVESNVVCGTTATSVTLAFGSNVASGDVLVAQVVVYDSSGTPTLNLPTDTLGNTYASVVSVGNTANGITATSQIWDTTTGSSGADTITFHSAANVTWCGYFSYELTGVSTSGVTTATGMGTTSGSGANTYQVSPGITFQSFTIAGLMSFESSPGTLTPTTSYTIAGGVTNIPWGSEYGTATGDAAMSMTYQFGEPADPWVLAAASFGSGTTFTTVTTVSSVTTTYDSSTTTTVTQESLTTTTTTTSTTTTSSSAPTLDTYQPAFIDILIFLLLVASAVTVAALLRKQATGKE